MDLNVVVDEHGSECMCQGVTTQMQSVYFWDFGIGRKHAFGEGMTIRNMAQETLMVARAHTHHIRHEDGRLWTRTLI